MKKKFFSTILGLFVSTATITIANAQTGNVGINTTTPSSTLHVKGKGNTNATQNLKLHNSDGTNLLTVNDDGTVSGIVVSNLGGASQLEKITENGKTGWRLLGSDAAFFGDTGTKAVSLVVPYSQTSATTSTAGSTGDYSFSAGDSNTSSGLASTTLGSENVASGIASTAFGNLNTASGKSSTAMGDQTKAIGEYSTSMGFITTASGFNALATGYNTTAAGNYSTTFGFSTSAKGILSIAAGESTIAPANYEVAIGAFNTDYTPGTFPSSNRAFVIGNGGNTTSRSDAFAVYKDGTVTFNNFTSTPLVTANRFYVQGNQPYYNGKKLTTSYTGNINVGTSTGQKKTITVTHNLNLTGTQNIQLTFKNSLTYEDVFVASVKGGSVTANSFQAVIYRVDGTDWGQNPNLMYSIIIE